MFQCLACSKQAATEEGNEQLRQTETVTGIEGGMPPTNQAVKSLTSQLKDMAMKFSSAHKQSRSSDAEPSTCRRGGKQTPRRNEPIASYAAEVCDSDDDIVWIAQVEPGVHITFTPLSTGGNDLRKIWFKSVTFTPAVRGLVRMMKKWWEENSERVQTQYQ